VFAPGQSIRKYLSTFHSRVNHPNECYSINPQIQGTRGQGDKGTGRQGDKGKKG